MFCRTVYLGSCDVILSRYVSCLKVHKAGLESDGLGERGGEAEKDYLVQVTLVSGHGLAVRDRTGETPAKAGKHLEHGQILLHKILSEFVFQCSRYLAYQ